MVEYTIETTSWSEVKLFWEKWKNYDISVQTYGLNIEGKIYTNTNTLDWKPEKNFGFYKDGVLLGCGKVLDIRTTGLSAIAGVASMCVDPSYRNNGIGSSLMKTMIQYMENNDFDYSMLYSSLYSKLIRFYEKFGYVDFNKVMILNLEKNPFKNKKELIRDIEDIGKF